MFICISAAETVLRNHLTGTISKTRFSRKIVTKINIPFKKQNIVGTKMHITPQSLLKKQKKIPEIGLRDTKQMAFVRNHTLQKG